MLQQLILGRIQQTTVHTLAITPLLHSILIKLYENSGKHPHSLSSKSILSVKMSINMILLILMIAILCSPALSFIPFNLPQCRQRRLDESFCSRPPSVMDVIPEAYATGIWYKIATSGSSDLDKKNNNPEYCTTINFTPKDNGKRFETLKCDAYPEAKRTTCMMGMGEWMMEEGITRVKLESQEGLSVVPYNIVALLGNANYGYFAVAVYGCEKKDGKFVEKLSFYARSPFQGKLTVYLLRRMLQCKGFRFKRDIKFVAHDRQCKYFYYPDGYDIVGMDEMYKKTLMSNLVETMVTSDVEPVAVRTEMTGSKSIL